MPAPRPSRHEGGFTLIEAVIASLILLVSVVFVAQMYVTAMRQNRTSRVSSHATAIAQSKLEELNAVPLAQIQYGGDLGTEDGGGRKGAEGYTDFVAADDVQSDKVGVVDDKEQANYVRYWKIEPDPGGWAGMYRITVRAVSLARSAGGGRPEEATLSTVRAQY